MPNMTRIFESVDHWSRVAANSEAIVFEDRRVTYGELGESVNHMAKALLESGVQPGDRIAMLAMACPEFIVSFLAASKVGASWLGLNPKLTTRELGYILSDCRPKILISVESCAGKNVREELLQLDLTAFGIERTVFVGTTNSGSDSFDAYVSSAREHLDGDLESRARQCQPSDEVLLMYTSGSTGKPKGVLQTHTSILVNVQQQAKFFLMDRHSRALLHFPINHVAADVEIGFATIFVGGTLVMMDRFDPAGSLAILGRERVTMFGQIPAMFLMQAAMPGFATTDFSSLKVVVWAGAAAPMKLLRGLQQICNSVGAKLMTGYGSTETCGFITYTRPDEDLQRLATSVGHAPEGFELRIVDDNRQPVSVGTIGELAVRGPFLFKEYLNQPAATAAAKDADGWFYTGDLGYLDADGGLSLSGRKSEMYKTGGENVFPSEIEDALCEHPSVALAAVIGVPDPVYQETGFALVMLRPGASVTGEELKEHCKATLANFKVPKAYEIRQTLPMLPNGKVDKLELKRELELSFRQGKEKV